MQELGRFQDSKRCGMEFGAKARSRVNECLKLELLLGMFVNLATGFCGIEVDSRSCRPTSRSTASPHRIITCSLALSAMIDIWKYITITHIYEGQGIFAGDPSPRKVISV